MAQPVWVLSVDLQTKTATFSSGLGEAAQNARKSFGDIRDAAQDMGKGVREGSRDASYSMMEARHSVMILSEEFGGHLPRALTTFIASLGPIGPALEAAFPWLAILLGATLLVEHLTKIGEAGEKAAEAGRKLDRGLGEAINKVDSQIVASEIEIRKLAGEPAWDLLGEKLRLKDAEQGFTNISNLEGKVKELLETAKATSNWNPLNWFDGSGDTAAKVKALKEQMAGKGDAEQAVILKENYDIQNKVLAAMKGQESTSSAALSNQQKYVDFLRQEAELTQKQADAATLADQASQGKDRADKLHKMEEEQEKAAAAQQRGLDRRIKIEEEYYRRSKELAKKAAEEATHDLAEINRYMQDEALKSLHLQEQVNEEAAQHTKKMAEMKLEAAQQQAKLDLSTKSGGSGDAARLKSEIDFANRKYQIDLQGYQNQLAALDKYDKDYELKVKQLQDKETELTRKHENDITAIQVKAEEERNERILSGEKRMQDEIARGLSQVLMRHESFAKMMNQLGGEVAQGMIQNAILSAMAMDFGKEKVAAHAARVAFAWGWDHGGPAAPVLAPVLGALAFASEMAFEEGGIVPGVGNHDSVHTVLTPGEAILPKDLTDGLTNVARSGSMGGDRAVHVHHHATYNVQALDAVGVDRVLAEHGDKFTRHAEKELRKRGY